MIGNYEKDKAAAVAWADALLDRDDVLIIDTETTGLHEGAEVCQLALINTRGEVLLDTLVRPYGEMDPGAEEVHGISMERLALAPRFDPVWAVIKPELAGRQVVIYNKAFDLKRMAESLAAAMVGAARQAKLETYRQARAEIDGAAASYDCAMHWYAQWVGDWSAWHGSYRWPRLPGGDHTALGDAQATLAVLRRMANRRDVPITILLTQEEIEQWSYHSYPPPDETLQAVIRDLLRTRANDTGYQQLIDDWMLMERVARGMFDRPGGWSEGAVVRANVLRRIQFGRYGNPFWRVHNLLDAHACMHAGKATKAQLEELIAQVRTAMDETITGQNEMAPIPEEVKPT